jgi:SnoaL-like domain
MRIASLALRNPNRYGASTTEAILATAGDGNVAQIDAGPAIVEAFVAGDSTRMIELLAPDATFHSPVTDYRGRERVARVLSALVQVVTDVRVTRVLDGPEGTAAFFTAAGDGRSADGVLHVLAAPGAPASELTLMLRPLETLHAGIERMKVVLGGDRGG